MKLNKTERWILSNQLSILAKLYPEDAASYEDMKTVIDYGFELHYKWISDHILDDQYMTEEKCLEVLDILDMFSRLQFGYEKLGDKSNINKNRVKFPGFDGNNEGAYLSYTLFLIDKEGKFDHLERGDNFNSHAPLLPLYRMMLDEWKRSNDKNELTNKDIERITSVSMK